MNYSILQLIALVTTLCFYWKPVSDLASTIHCFTTVFYIYNVFTLGFLSIYCLTTVFNCSLLHHSVLHLQCLYPGISFHLLLHHSVQLFTASPQCFTHTMSLPWDFFPFNASPQYSTVHCFTTVFYIYNVFTLGFLSIYCFTTVFNCSLLHHSVLHLQCLYPGISFHLMLHHSIQLFTASPQCFTFTMSLPWDFCSIYCFTTVFFLNPVFWTQMCNSYVRL